MFRNVLICMGLVLGIQVSAQSQSDIEVKTLTLPEVIDLAHEQSLMALVSRHQFRSSYWEYRYHQARFKPGLTLEGTVPSLTNATESVIQPDGSEEFVARSVMNTSLELELNQNIALTGGHVFARSSLQRTDNFGDEQSTNFLAYPFSIGFRQPINGYNEFKWERKIEPLKFEQSKLVYLNTMGGTLGNEYLSGTGAKTEHCTYGWACVCKI